MPADARSSPHPSALLRPCLRPSEPRPGPFRPVKTASSGGGRYWCGGSFDGTERAGPRSDGRTQGQNSADGCGEDRASADTGWAFQLPHRVTGRCTARAPDEPGRKLTPPRDWNGNQTAKPSRTIYPGNGYSFQCSYFCREGTLLHRVAFGTWRKTYFGRWVQTIVLN